MIQKYPGILKKLSVLITVLLFITACRDTAFIATPIILVDKLDPKAYEEIHISTKDFIIINGDLASVEKYDWSIYDSDGKKVTDDFKNVSSITWKPKESGTYSIKVKLKTENIRSIEAEKKIVVFDSPRSLHNKIAGDWIGYAHKFLPPDPKPREIELNINFDKEGYCSGEVTKDYDNGCTSIFFGHGTQYSKNGMGTGCDSNSNAPCQRILIERVDNNIGSGSVWVGHGNVEDDKPVEWTCIGTTYTLDQISTNTQGNELYITLGSWYGGENKIEYTLVKN